MIFDTSSSLRDRAPDLGLLAPSRLPPPLDPFVDPLQPVEFALRGGPLTFIRSELAIVGHLLAVIGGSFALIGDAFSFVSNPFASVQLVLTPCESGLPLHHVASAPLIFRPGVGGVFTDHDSP